MRSTATALTDSSTGAAPALVRCSYVAAAANTANSGTNLADKTTTEAAMTTVKNGLRRFTPRRNTALTVLGSRRYLQRRWFKRW
jgi:hypothetical protein